MPPRRSGPARRVRARTTRPRLAAARIALASLDELQRTASRILDAFGEQLDRARDVVWLDRPFTGRYAPAADAAGGAARGRAGLLRSRLFGARTVSAHLGDARPRRLVRAAGQPVGPETWPPSTGIETWSWTGLDVGSPFDHPRSGILYVARHLPPPGRDQLAEAYLTELDELIDAAGGRTLGLFSSMRAAEQAAEALRERDQPAAALPGRRRHRPAGQAVRRGRADLPVRHAVAVAGRGRARDLRCSWSSSTGSRSRGPTTRSPRPGSGRWPPAAATGS